MAPKKTPTKGAKGKAKAAEKDEKKTTKVAKQTKGKGLLLQFLCGICDHPYSESVY